MHKFIDNIVAFSLKNKFFIFFCTVIAVMKIRNPNPFPIGNKFGFFMYGGA